jgi:YidC/Oxa1 family membrane protein insertase
MAQKAKFPKVLFFILLVFVCFCGVLVWESGLFANNVPATGGLTLLQQTTTEQKQEVSVPREPEIVKLEPAALPTLGADNAPAETVLLGSTDPDSGYNFELELTTKGAAIRKATFSGFDDRDPDDPQPLVILSPLELGGGREILPMASGGFVFVEHKLRLPLDRLHWESLGVERLAEGKQTAIFEAVIVNKDSGEPVIKLTKTYTVAAGSYLLSCDLAVENLSAAEQKCNYNLSGPVGIGIEGIRSDMRNVVGGVLTPDGQVVASQKDLLIGFPMNLFTKNVGLKDTTRKYEEALRTRDPAKIKRAKADLRVGRNLEDSQKNANFLWAATTNKYFAAIVRPVPREGKDYCDWIKDTTAQYYNPDEDQRGNTGDETIGVNLEIAPSALAAAGQPGNTNKYNFQLYLGPKDKNLFDGNQLYSELGFIHTITFMSCFCCPDALINPISFFILALMKWLYGFIGNYGVVIIVLVFLMRLLIHPLTKQSQISMNKFTKFNALPEVQEIRKKYAKNMMEMNKHIAVLQKQHGVSHHHMIMGMLPMLIQMPVWIALWRAVYGSVDLRGAGFLPFWITDLSVPDALFSFPAVTLPLFGKLDSFNLLPILMGVAFYLQQKLMPSQASAQANPQVAQQQKMMMVMMPILFPLLLYKGPSGVNLYIMSSVFAGAAEQYVIRKHIREKEQAESKGLVAATSKTGGKVKKKKPKPFYKNM